MVSPRRSPSPAAARAAFVVLVAAVLQAGAVPPAAAQCTRVTGPTSFVDYLTFPPYNGTGFTSQVLPYSNGSKLVTGTDWSYGVYDLTSPMSPLLVGWDDLRYSIGMKKGDGQSYYDRLGVSADGQRFLVSLSSAGSVAHGNTLAFSPGAPPALFTAGGDFGRPQAGGGAVVQHVGGRYIAYTVQSASGGALIAADVTSLPGYTPGDPSPSILNVSSEVTAFPAGAGSRDLALLDPYLVYLSGGNVVIIAAQNPGPPGSIASGYTSWQLSPADFGRLSGENLSAVGATVDPSTGTGNRIYVVGEFASAGAPAGFTLLRFDRSGASHTSTILGSFVPPAPFSGTSALPGLSVTLTPSGTDVLIALWAKSSTGGAGGGRALRLYATSVRNWSSLTPASQPVVQVDAATNPAFSGVAQTALVTGAGTNVYAYVATGFGGYALQMSCPTGPTPVAANLIVQPVPCPGGGSVCPLSDGAMVYVGDALSVTPLVNPPSAILPVTGWNLDFNYHAAAENAGASYPQLRFADAFGAGDPTGSFTLVGPCDKQIGGTNPADGTNCWSSVLGNSAFGGPDFVSPFTPGTTKNLPIAFEANNSLGSAGLKVFNLSWKIPAVKPQNLSALLGAGNVAALQDGSEGHPIPTGYKWYFGGATPAPSTETLTLDTDTTNCPGATCNHAFPLGKGTYNAWLTASYAGGYASPDCGTPCTLPKTGSFVVTVSDFVADFTADANAYIGGNGINVTNHSLIGGGVTLNGYLYSLCDASQVSCQNDQEPYQGLTIGAPPAGTGTISPVPSTPGTYWLRIKATYNVSSIAQWQPNVTGVADPKAWPIAVSTTPPTLRPTAGFTYCTVGGCPSPYQAAVGTPVTVAAFQGSTQLTGAYTWNITSGTGSPSNASGSTFTFTPGASGGLHVSADVGGGQPIGLDILITGGAPPPPPPPPPSGLTVYVIASDTSVVPGSKVTFVASPEGGSEEYFSFSWNFGDGTTGSDRYVTAHTYGSAGTYQVSCRVTDTGGLTGTGYATISVSTGGGGPGGGCAVSSFNVLQGGALAGNSASGILTVPAGVSIGFVPLPGGAGSSFSWSFGDGSSDSTRNANHTYNTPGSYTVRLTVDGSCTVSVTLNVTGGVGPPNFKIADATGRDITPGTDGSFLVVGGQQVTLRAVNATSGQLLSGSVSWNFGDSSTATTNPAPKTWATIGTFSVTLTVSGQAPVVHNVNAVGGIPTGAYSFVYGDGGLLDPTRAFLNRAIIFTATGSPAAAYDWDFGDGTVVPSGPSSITHTFTIQGSHTVVLTARLGANSFRTPTPTLFTVVELPQWVLPGLAYASGMLPGSFYVSDVVIQNPSADESGATFSVALLDGQNPPDWKPLGWFQPRESRRIPNILKNVFGKSPGGPAVAMLIRGDKVPAEPAIWAFTYNNNGGDRVKGTYGVAIPGVSVSSAVGSGSPESARVFPALRDIPLTALPNVSAAYTNIGFVNVGSVDAKINVSFLSRGLEGPVQLGSTFPVWIAPNSAQQFNQPLRLAFAGSPQPYETFEADDYFLSFEVVGVGARVVPYATVKDVGSSDSIFLTPMPNVSSPVRVPSVVRVNTDKGDKFRSRVVIFNPSAQDRDVTLTFSYVRCPAGQPCDTRAEMGHTWTLAAGGTILTDDLVRDWFANIQQVVVDDTDAYTQSYLDVAPADTNPEPLIVRAETYNSQPGGNFGTQVPGLIPVFHAASPTGARKRLMIPYVVPKVGQSGYRTNVALVSLGSGVAQARLKLHAPFQGAVVPAVQDQIVTVDDTLLQRSLESLFPDLASFPPNGWGHYSLEIEVMSGTLAAYAVINDNVTSDGNLILAQPLP